MPEPISQQQFEDALTQKHAAGQLLMCNIVPAVYGMWHEAITGTEVWDHVHLPAGTPLDYEVLFDPETRRIDGMFTCATLCRDLLSFLAAGRVTVAYLN